MPFCRNTCSQGLEIVQGEEKRREKKDTIHKGWKVSSSYIYLSIHIYTCSTKETVKLFKFVQEYLGVTTSHALVSSASNGYI